MRFIFFTKTDWAEPPRLRHQMARLLASNGHNVVFFQKPRNIFTGSCSKVNLAPSVNNIEFVRTDDLFHHKLRVNKFIGSLNASFEIQQIKKIMTTVRGGEDDVLMNFNFDYYFLRKIFPKNKIVTIINDNFWCRAIFGYSTPLKNALIATCKNSDLVFAVSEPLIEELSEFCDPHLVLPWSEKRYLFPNLNSARNQLLFWGYINDRLNFDYIERLVNGIKERKIDVVLRFVGPVQANIDRRFRQMVGDKHVLFEPAVDIQFLNTENVLAALIPYIEGNEADDATTVPNKAFPMLANGLPLLITGMPRFIDRPFVFRLGQNVDDDVCLIKKMPTMFSCLQPSIQDFLNGNNPSDRYKQIISLISGI